MLFRGWRPKLSLVLLVMNLVVLALPIAGIYLLRIYESALVRQTESGLISQGALVSATFKTAVQRADPDGASFHDYSQEISVLALSRLKRGKGWRPPFAKLDLAIDKPLPDISPPKAIENSPSEVILTAGAEIIPQLKDAQLITLSSIRVVDTLGNIVASTGQQVGTWIGDREEVQQALLGEHVSILRERDPITGRDGWFTFGRASGIRVFVATPIVMNDKLIGAVVIARTPASLDRALAGKQKELLLALALVVGIVVFFSFFTGITVVRPVHAVTDQAKRAAKGEQGAVVPLERPVTQEVAVLSQEVATMARTLEERANYIGEFAAQVSHEFKTPLTSIQGTVELLRDHFDTMPAERRDRFLANLEGDAERLSILVSRLLEMARADVARPTGQERSSLAHSFHTLTERAEQRSQRLLIQSSRNGDLELSIKQEDLDTILGNLFDNCWQHGTIDTLTQITVDENIKGTIRIQIQDDGPGISDANKLKIFEPFFTTAREAGGTGLGLPMVASLAAAYGGSFQLVETDEPGTVFELTLLAAV